jgi:glutamate racemase
LLHDEIAAASPVGVTLVDSGEGIARRTVHLTQGREWTRAPGRAVFTRDGDDLALLAPALARYGLRDIDIL